MAGTSPTRRSSRARITQSQSQISSTASSSSGRAERTTRAFNKTGSPQKSTGSGSLSSEPPEDSTTTNDDSLHRRRSTRGKDDDRDKLPKPELLGIMPPVTDDIQEDDESVRCICGHDEYPGPPPFDEDSKHGIKDTIDHDRIFAIEITDDMAGFFVQCEICNTWQHGACVGFTTEESNPDDLEYFCEQCRKDLHKIYTASNGQKYSIFLPIHRPSQAASRATSATKEGARSPKPTGGKSARASAASTSSKRRSTMNSRDAAYDEEEQLRRAIAASKEETIPEDSEPSSRRPKRGREESEEYVVTAPAKFDSQLTVSHSNPENVKRQRTNSKSPSVAPEDPGSAVVDDSDDDPTLRNGSSKKLRNTVRNQRERAERDERREEQERKRAEAASKRKGRAERRRADDSDPSDELPLATRATTANRASESAQPPDPPLISSQPPPDTPPAPAPASSATTKKKPVMKKKGRNQYTKERDNDHDASPARSVSRDISKNADDGATTATTSTKTATHEGTGKQGRGKGGMNSRVTMTDMKRRANGIMEFISRKQVELASDAIAATTSPARQLLSDAKSAKVNGSPEKKSAAGTPITNGEGEPLDPLKEFRDMSCVEMMDSLTRDLVKWQREFVPS
ncbi:hypothetical protein GGR57DRAFT_308574 [Xylariaceae sp. FL1272]|nr:hypothetical protein GGR57DRAFT_308574 [Xylariaceae sp. FL1272]